MIINEEKIIHIISSSIFLLVYFITISCPECWERTLTSDFTHWENRQRIETAQLAYTVISGTSKMHATIIFLHKIRKSTNKLSLRAD